MPRTYTLGVTVKRLIHGGIQTFPDRSMAFDLDRFQVSVFPRHFSRLRSNEKKMPCIVLRSYPLIIFARTGPQGDVQPFYRGEEYPYSYWKERDTAKTFLLAARSSSVRTPPLADQVLEPDRAPPLPP